VWFTNNLGTGFTSQTPTIVSSTGIVGADGIWFLDINDDGPADVVFRNGSTVEARLSTGAVFHPTVFLMTNSAIGDLDPRKTVFGDFDGDDYKDMIDFTQTGVGQHQINFYRNNHGNAGVALDSAVVQAQYAGSTHPIAGGAQADTQFVAYAAKRSVDSSWNVDPYEDLIVSYQNPTYGHVDMYTGSSGFSNVILSSYSVISTVAYYGDRATAFADVNGDGRADGLVSNTGTPLVVRR
jgi:hypothetical protein